jgi:hypothetical protein
MEKPTFKWLPPLLIFGVTGLQTRQLTRQRLENFELTITSAVGKPQLPSYNIYDQQVLSILNFWVQLRSLTTISIAVCYYPADGFS